AVGWREPGSSRRPRRGCWRHGSCAATDAFGVLSRSCTWQPGHRLRLWHVRQQGVGPAGMRLPVVRQHGQRLPRGTDGDDDLLPAAQVEAPDIAVEPFTSAVAALMDDGGEFAEFQADAVLAPQQAVEAPGVALIGPAAGEAVSVALD